MQKPSKKLLILVVILFTIFNIQAQDTKINSVEIFAGVTTAINATTYKTFYVGQANKYVQVAVNQPFEKETITAGLKKYYPLFKNVTFTPWSGFFCTPSSSFFFNDTSIKKTLISLQVAGNFCYSPGISKYIVSSFFCGAGFNYYTLRINRYYKENGGALFCLGYTINHQKSGYGCTLQFSKQFLNGEYQISKNSETYYLSFSSFRNQVTISLNKQFTKKNYLN